MRKLVPHEPKAVRRPRLKAPAREDDVIAVRVRIGPDGTSRFRCPGIDVDSHVAEVVPEALLHPGLQVGRKGLPRFLQYLMNQRRASPSLNLALQSALVAHPFFTGFALALYLVFAARLLRHAIDRSGREHLRRQSVRLALCRIRRIRDRQSEARR